MASHHDLYFSGDLECALPLPRGAHLSGQDGSPDQQGVDQYHGRGFSGRVQFQ